MAPHLSRTRKVLLTAALVTGTSLGAAGIATAATSSTSNSTSSSGPSGYSGTTTPPGAGAVDPATVTHGPGETLLTGTDLERATAAAKAAVPGATIIRAETDSSGASTYEVHMKKTDGSYVTVELSSSFQVVKTISGFGGGPAGGNGPGGMPSSSPSNAA